MASQKISRGFHRLGIFLAAIPLLIGGAASIIDALDQAGRPREYPISTEQLKQPKLNIEGVGTVPAPPSFNKLTAEQQNEMVDEIATAHWRSTFANALLLNLALTLAGALTIYGLFRAIGWVIGGFASS